MCLSGVKVHQKKRLELDFMCSVHVRQNLNWTGLDSHTNFLIHNERIYRKISELVVLKSEIGFCRAGFPLNFYE